MTEDMPRQRPMYVRHEKTRHGKWTWAFRRGKEYRRLPDEYGTPEFWNSYRDALAGKKSETPVQPQTGTLAWLVSRYQESAKWSALAQSTQDLRKNILKSLVASSGSKPFATIERRHIQAAMDAKRKTPNAANNALVVTSQLFKWAKSMDFVKANPCDGVESIRVSSDGFHTWTEEEVEQYRTRHPVGTKARLALDLLLFVGLRRSDLVRLGRQHVRHGVITITTIKNNETVHVPIFAELQKSIDATPTGDLAFLTSATRMPFASGGSFANWFRERCREAGLPKECSAHGLRKAGATIAANEGASTRELMAMFGWKRSAMAEKYTKAADKIRLARAAAERIANRQVTYHAQESNVPSPEALENKGRKSGV